MRKINIGILDEGIDKWWESNDEPLSQAYSTYFDGFEMSFGDFADKQTPYEGIPAGNHGFWVLDRLLQVCGNKDKVKIFAGKVFPRSNKSANQAILDGLDYMIQNRVDLLNLSLGVPRYARANSRIFLAEFNAKLNELMSQGGFTIIAAGNEGEILSNGKVIENGNLLADDPNNNLSVSSHDKNGAWDNFSSAGGTVDVSAIGSNLSLVGRKQVSVVSGTSFSTPTFCGVCANYLIDQMTSLTEGKKTSKEIIFEHLSEAIQPVYRNKWTKWLKRRDNTNNWFGVGSFESYAKYFISYYGRDVLQSQLFSDFRRVQIV